MYKLDKKKRKPSKKRTLIAIISVFVVAILSFGGYRFSQRNNVVAPNPTTTSETPENLKKENEENKEAIVSQSAPTSEQKETTTEAAPVPTGQKRAVTPLITFGDYSDSKKTQIEVNAFIPGVFENNGTCTLTASQGALKVTKQVSGFGNASQTNCENILVARSEFSNAGIWKITVSYQSPASNGTSATKDIVL